MIDPRTDEVFAFGDYRLDVRQGALFRNGEIVRIPPKAFELLQALVARANEVVSKEELLARLWPDTFVTEAMLARNVFILRRELGNAPDGSAYIDTIPKRGYRFVGAPAIPPAAVEAPAPAEASPAPIETQPKRRPRTRRRSIVYSAIAVLSAFLLIVVFAFLPARKSAAQARALHVVVLPFVGTAASDGVFARGVSELVAARLSGLRTLSVIAPMATVPFSSSSALEIARNFGANVVISGTIHRSASRTLITCTVMLMEEGAQLKPATFEVSSSDLFELEGELVRKVVSLLELHESLSEHPDRVLITAVRQQTYLRGLGLISKAEAQYVEQGLELIEPLAATGDSPLVFSALARGYLQLFRRSRSEVDLARAEEWTSRTAAAGGDPARVRALLGAIHLFRGDTEKAVAELKSSLALHPDDVEVLLDLARAYHLLGSQDDAEATYEHVVSIHPDCAGCYINYGTFHSKNGRNERAMELYRRAVAINPRNPIALANLAAASIKLGRFAEAIPFAEASLKIRETAAGRAQLASCRYLLGDFAGAARDFEATIRLDPKFTQHWGALGDALGRIPGKERAAQDAYRTAVELAQEQLRSTPGESMIRGFLAEYLAKTGDLRGADREMRQALAERPRSSDVLYSAAVIAVMTDTDAAELIERAIDSGVSPMVFAHDPQFAALRQQPKFAALVAPRPRRVAGP